jgi:hypothetical protein
VRPMAADAHLKDASFMLRTFSSPGAGPHIRFDTGYAPGEAANYGFALVGTEAVTYTTLRRFIEVVEKAGGTVTSAQVRDIDVGGDWESLIA